MLPAPRALGVVGARSSAPPAGPAVIVPPPVEPPYSSATRFITSPDELKRLVASSNAVMVLVGDENSLRRPDGEAWDRFVKETAGKVDCVRASRATFDAAVGARTNERARYFAFNDHELYYESAELSKRPFCDALDCPVIDMPKSDRPKPPPILSYNEVSLGTLRGPTPLSFEQGQLNDCALVAGLMAFSHAMPEALAAAFHENYDGTLTVTLPGVEKPLRFDSRLYAPGDYAIQLYAHQRLTAKLTTWGPLLEKGFAMLAPQGYVGLKDISADGVLTMLTGRMFRGAEIAKMAQPERLLELLRQASHVPMVAYATAQPELHVPQSQSNECHAFAVFGVETDSRGVQYVVLANPWGSAGQEFRSKDYDADATYPGGQRSDHDGVFRVSVDDFRRLFFALIVPADMLHNDDLRYCHLSTELDKYPYGDDFRQDAICR